ncbi:thioredoxin family protein [Aurantimonas sp. VKM B-3413]|uniref:DUF1223 domain-containing protein n=1 Tax=Aurantimonas sp. VKM B-3413 TaxID=2779401 RepID=UPI001E28E377|nr:DUF1223 domain-containing protein [Aurantimonas sp. VKM B-3413]MCB8839173.1 DUF1223 domain-containing protein [Aurantimonas sp. VKM B-3413]
MPSKLFAAALISSLSLVSAAAIASPAAAGARHVVELFTSQGCSSCPPADAVLAGLALRTDLLALGFHVDYWDALGWKDTLGSPAHSARQRAYAGARGDGQIYTPQAVVDGQGHTVGSNGRAIGQMMLASPLPVDLEFAGDSVLVAAGKGSGSLWRVDYTGKAEVPIGRGENSGRTVTYVNAVRGMTLIGRWNGKAARYPLGACGSARGADACAVILQAGDQRRPGAILGAATR